MMRDLFDAGTVRPELMPFYPIRPWVAYPSAAQPCATGSFLCDLIHGQWATCHHEEFYDPSGSWLILKGSC